MKADLVLWRVAIACGVLLLFAAMTPRTSWTALGGGEMGSAGGGATHSAGWDWIAPIAGIVAVVGLFAGRGQRPRVAGAVTGAAIASLSLGIAAAAALGHWLDLMSGSLDEMGWTTSPAPAVAYFAAIAAAGMAASLILLGCWLRPGDIRATT